ncbi:MAG: type II toxin-antitoxin system YhaV family toxin, partial [Planctomycetes bacterium]|nr:type II toxin-antitoxin system YhaV family toxin [Planctomycetota bacterium]
VPPAVSRLLLSTHRNTEGAGPTPQSYFAAGSICPARSRQICRQSPSRRPTHHTPRPNKREYQLKATLKKFRRYKRGLKRYRLFFCFSSRPPIILYLYLNDEKHLRQAGSKKDPYEPFKGLVSRGIFSHDPSDEKIQAWIRSLLAVAR